LTPASESCDPRVATSTSVGAIDQQSSQYDPTLVREDCDIELLSQ
jgi:hypothetical protein